MGIRKIPSTARFVFETRRVDPKYKQNRGIEAQDGTAKHWMWIFSAAELPMEARRLKTPSVRSLVIGNCTIVRSTQFASSRLTGRSPLPFQIIARHLETMHD